MLPQHPLCSFRGACLSHRDYLFKTYLLSSSLNEVLIWTSMDKVQKQATQPFDALRTGTEPSSHHCVTEIGLICTRKASKLRSWRILLSCSKLMWIQRSKFVLKSSDNAGFQLSPWVLGRFSLILLGLDSSCFVWCGRNHLRKSMMNVQVAFDNDSFHLHPWIFQNHRLHDYRQLLFDIHLQSVSTDCGHSTTFIELEKISSIWHAYYRSPFHRSYKMCMSARQRLPPTTVLMFHDYVASDSRTGSAICLVSTPATCVVLVGELYKLLGFKDTLLT